MSSSSRCEDRTYGLNMCPTCRRDLSGKNSIVVDFRWVEWLLVRSPPVLQMKFNHWRFWVIICLKHHLRKGKKYLGITGGGWETIPRSCMGLCIGCLAVSLSVKIVRAYCDIKFHFSSRTLKEKAIPQRETVRCRLVCAGRERGNNQVWSANGGIHMEPDQQAATC